MVPGRLDPPARGKKKVLKRTQKVSLRHNSEHTWKRNETATLNYSLWSRVKSLMITWTVMNWVWERERSGVRFGGFDGREAEWVKLRSRDIWLLFGQIRSLLTFLKEWFVLRLNLCADESAFITLDWNPTTSVLLFKTADGRPWIWTVIPQELDNWARRAWSVSLKPQKQNVINGRRLCSNKY